MLPSSPTGFRHQWLGLAVFTAALGSAGCAPDFIYAARFVSTPSGASVVFRAKGTRMWLRRRSLENGALLASARFLGTERRYFGLGCRPSVPGRLWCLENSDDSLADNGLTVRDEETLEVIANQRGILGAVPELNREPPFRHWGVDPKTHGFHFGSRDGYSWMIDPKTLVPSRFEAPLLAPEMSESSRCYGWRVGGDCYTLGGGTRKTLERNGVALHPEHTYLNPQPGPAVDGWPNVLIVEDVLEHWRWDGARYVWQNEHSSTLWCLLPDGTVNWKVTDFADRYVVNAKLYRDTVVLVLTKGLIALRARDGTVAWSSPP